MKTRVLDSWAILQWMSGRQPATSVVRELLADAEEGRTRLLMSAINVGAARRLQDRMTVALARVSLGG